MGPEPLAYLRNVRIHTTHAYLDNDTIWDLQRIWIIGPEVMSHLTGLDPS